MWRVAAVAYAACATLPSSSSDSDVHPRPVELTELLRDKLLLDRLDAVVLGVPPNEPITPPNPPPIPACPALATPPPAPTPTAVTRSVGPVPSPLVILTW